MSEAVLLFGHGARDARWARPFVRVRDRMRAAMPDRTVELAFLEFMEPDLPAAIDRLAGAGAARVVLMPLFLGAGGHVLRDLPALLEAARARHPGLVIESLPALGEHDAVLDMIADGCIALVAREAGGSGPAGAPRDVSAGTSPGKPASVPADACPGKPAGVPDSERDALAR